MPRAPARGGATGSPLLQPLRAPSSHPPHPAPHPTTITQVANLETRLKREESRGSLMAVAGDHSLAGGGLAAEVERLVRCGLPPPQVGLVGRQQVEMDGGQQQWAGCTSSPPNNMHACGRQESPHPNWLSPLCHPACPPASGLLGEGHERAHLRHGGSQQQVWRVLGRRAGLACSVCGHDLPVLCMQQQQQQLLRRTPGLRHVVVHAGTRASGRRGSARG